MFWRGLSIAIIVLAWLGASGCLKTEADFQALLEDTNTLGTELDEARQENEILTRALDDIKREQETLQLLLNAGKSNLNAARTSLPSAAVASGGDPDEWQSPQTPADSPSPPSALPQVASPPAASLPAPPAPAARYYTTKPGDVLSHIARANDTTVPKLLELNPSLRNRNGNMIYANERLRLP